MVLLDIPAADNLCASLKQHHVYTDSRKGRYLRLAPFIWNTEEEIDRAFDIIAALLRSNAHLSTSSPVLSTGGPVT